MTKETDALKKLQSLKKDIALGLEQADKNELLRSEQVFKELRRKNSSLTSKK